MRWFQRRKTFEEQAPVEAAAPAEAPKPVATAEPAATTPQAPRSIARRTRTRPAGRSPRTSLPSGKPLQGATALRGRLDPHHVQEYSDRHCWFRREGAWTLVHSRHDDVVSAIERGAAEFTRLDGEWWLRFLGG